jgi:phage-related baseplate assembly protein
MPADVTLLKSDPATKILEIVVFREMILRERINNVAKANLLAFAGGNDLNCLPMQRVIFSMWPTGRDYDKS